MADRIGYGTKVDAIVYGHKGTLEFTRLDWLELARAALDQAGTPPWQHADRSACEELDELIAETRSSS